MDIGAFLDLIFSAEDPEEAILILWDLLSAVPAPTEQH